MRKTHRTAVFAPLSATFLTSITALASGGGMPMPTGPREATCLEIPAQTQTTEVQVRRFGRDAAGCIGASDEFRFLNRVGVHFATDYRCEVEPGSHEHVLRLTMRICRNAVQFSEVLDAGRSFAELDACLAYEKRVADLTTLLPASLGASFSARCNLVTDTPTLIRYVPLISFSRSVPRVPSAKTP